MIPNFILEFNIYYSLLILINNSCYYLNVLALNSCHIPFHQECSSFSQGVYLNIKLCMQFFPMILEFLWIICVKIFQRENAQVLMSNVRFSAWEAYACLQIFHFQNIFYYFFFLLILNILRSSLTLTNCLFSS